jgi:hypothetical protein
MSAPPPPSAGSIETPESAPPEQYAVAAVEAHEALAEEPPSRSRRLIEFLSSATKQMWETFKGADLVGKGAMVAAGAVTAYVGIKLIEKGVSLFRGSWNKVSSLGDSLDEGLEKVRGFSIKKTIAILVGGSALVALFTNMDEIMELWDEAKLHPEGLFEGLKAGIAARVLSGALDISDERWDELAAEHSWFPSRETRDAAKGVVTDVKDSLEDVKKGIDVGLDKMAEWDEKSGLKALRGRMWGFLDEKFEGWRDSPILVMIKDLDDPAKIAEHLSLDTPEKRSAFLDEMQGAALGAGAVGAGSYLLHSLMDSPWVGPITGVNVALYMVMQNEKMDAALVGSFKFLKETADALHNQVQLVATKMGIKPEWLLLQDEGFGVKSMMDYTFKKMIEHPDLTALTILNAGFLERKLIWSFIKDSFFFIVNAAQETGEFIIEHKEVSGLMMAVGGVILIERRKVISDLAEIFYPDDADARREFIDDITGFLNKFEITRISDTPGKTEAALLPVYERFIKDPLEFISDPDNSLALYELTKDGHLEWHVLEPGKTVAVGWFFGANPLSNALHLGWYEVEALFDEWDTRGLSMDNLGVYGTYTGELVITTAAIYGAARSGLFQLGGFHGAEGGTMRAIRANWAPWAPEFRQTLRSMARASLDTVTLSEATSALQGRRLHKVSSEVARVLTVVEEVKGSGKVSSANLRELAVAKKNMGRLSARGSQVHYADAEFITEVQVLDKLVEDIWSGSNTARASQAAGKSTEAKAKISEISDMAGELKNKHSLTQSKWSRRLGRVQQLIDVKFRGIESDYVPVKHGQEITTRGIERLSNPALRAHAQELSLHGLSRESLIELDRSGSLTESAIKDFLRDVKSDKTLAPKMNEIAYMEQYAKQLKFVHEFQKYGALAMVIAMVYGFQHADDKADFLIQTSAHLSGFAAGVGAVRVAETTMTNKLPPIYRLAADLAVGTVFALGAGKAVDAYAMEPLDKYFPNRNQVDLDNISYSMYVAGGGPVFDIFELAGVGDGVNQNTHPLDYLTDSVTTLRPFGGGFFDDGMLQEVRLNDMAEFTQKAADKIEKYEGKIAKKAEKRRGLDPSSAKAIQLDKDIMKLMEAILHLQTYVDGRWVHEVRELLEKQEELVQKARLIFMEIADDHEWPNDTFGDRGSSMVSSAVTRVGSGQDLVDKEDKDIWQYLSDYPAVDTGDGKGTKISFRDFIALATLVDMRKKQLTQLGMDIYNGPTFFERAREGATLNLPVPDADPSPDTDTEDLAD